MRASVASLRVLEDRGVVVSPSICSHRTPGNAAGSNNSEAGGGGGRDDGGGAVSTLLIGSTILFVSQRSTTNATSTVDGQVAASSAAALDPTQCDTVVQEVDLLRTGVLLPQDMPCQSYAWVGGLPSNVDGDGVGVFVGAAGDLVIALFARRRSGGSSASYHASGTSVARIAGRATDNSDVEKGTPTAAKLFDGYAHAGGEPLSVLVSYHDPPSPPPSTTTGPTTGGAAGTARTARQQRCLMQLQLLWVDAAAPTTVSFAEVLLQTTPATTCGVTPASPQPSCRALVSRVLREADASGLFADGLGQRRANCVQRIHAVHWCGTTMDYTGGMHCFALTVDATPTPTDPVVRVFALAMVLDRETTREAATRRSALSRWWWWCGPGDDDASATATMTMRGQLGEGPWRLEPTTVVCPQLIVHLRVPASVSTGASMAFTAATTAQGANQTQSGSAAGRAAYDDVFGLLQSIPTSIGGNNTNESTLPEDGGLRQLDMLHSGRDSANVQLLPPPPQGSLEADGGRGGYQRRRPPPAGTDNTMQHNHVHSRGGAAVHTQYVLYGSKGVVASYKLPGDVVCAALCGGGGGGSSSTVVRPHPSSSQLSLCCLTKHHHTTPSDAQPPPCSAYVLRVSLHEQRSTNSLRRPTSASGGGGGASTGHQADWNTISYLSIVCRRIDIVEPLRNALSLQSSCGGDVPQLQYVFPLHHRIGNGTLDGHPSSDVGTGVTHSLRVGATATAPTTLRASERMFVGAVSLVSPVDGNDAAVAAALGGCAFSVAELTVRDVVAVEGDDHDDDEGVTLNAAVMWGHADHHRAGVAALHADCGWRGDSDGQPMLPAPPPRDAWCMSCPMEVPLQLPAAAVVGLGRAQQLLWSRCGLLCLWHPQSTAPSSPNAVQLLRTCAAPFAVAASVWERAALWRVSSDEGFCFDRLCGVNLPGHPPMAVLVDASMRAYMLSLPAEALDGGTPLLTPTLQKSKQSRCAAMVDQIALVPSVAGSPTSAPAAETETEGAPPPRLIPTQLEVVANQQPTALPRPLATPHPAATAGAPDGSMVSATWWMVLSAINVVGNATFLLLRGRAGIATTTTTTVGDGTEGQAAQHHLLEGSIDVADVFRGFARCVPVFLLVAGDAEGSPAKCDVLFVAESVVRSLTVVLARGGGSQHASSGGCFARRRCRPSGTAAADSNASVGGNADAIEAAPVVPRELCTLTRSAPDDASPLDGFGNPTLAWRMLEQEYASASHAFWFDATATDKAQSDGERLLGCFCFPPGGRWVLVEAVAATSPDGGGIIGPVSGQRRLHVTRVLGASASMPRRSTTFVADELSGAAPAAVVQRIVSTCGSVRLERRCTTRMEDAETLPVDGRRVAQALQLALSSSAGRLMGGDGGQHPVVVVAGGVADCIVEASDAAQPRPQPCNGPTLGAWHIASLPR